MPSPSLLTAKHKNRDRPKKKRISATVVPVSSPYSCDVMFAFMCDFCSLSVLLCVAALPQTNSSNSSTSNISTSFTAVVIYCGRFSRLPQTFRSYRFDTKLTYKLSQVSLPALSSISFFGPRDKTSQTNRQTDR
jgi:hypothetical protein